MKPFRTLTRRISQWRQEHLPSDVLRHPFKQTVQTTVVRGIGECTKFAQTYLTSDRIQDLLRSRPIRRKPQEGNRVHPPVFFIVTVVSLTSAIGYRLYNEPQLGVGTIAPQTLRAPAAARVIDTKTTEANRKAARIASIPVLTIDQTVNQEIEQTLQRLLNQGDSLRRTAGAFPFVQTSVLSTETQQYLRQANEWEWRIVLSTVEEGRANAGVPPMSNSGQTTDSISAHQQLTILELQNYRRSYSIEDFSALKEVVERARQRYSEAVDALTAKKTSHLDNFYSPMLLQLTDADWEKTQAATHLVLRRVLAQGVAPGLPDSLLQNAIQIHLQSEAPMSAIDLSTQILIAAIQPNLVQDPTQTKLRAEQAAQAVKDVVVEIQQNEVIVRLGEPITQADFVLLDHFGLSRRHINWLGLSAFALLISGAVVIFLVVERRFHPGLRRRDHLLLLLLTLGVSLIVALDTPAIGLPALGLLAGSFYGSVLGVTAVGLLSLVLPIGMEVSWISLIASAAGGLLGAALAGRLRSREELAMLGGAVGITQGMMYLILTLILSTATTPVWYIVLTSAALQCLLGIAWSIVALGVSPYLENLFDLITPIRLAELSNPNRPLLKRLASEAPGTFQHTLFVATLAEAAARTLRCNVELVRAGTLYHDIGKMHDPKGFIENQMGGPNKHDAIDDPWQSAAIIKRHVSEGLVMARKYRLPKAIQAFIPEHQGTMSISYFHHQAQQRVKENPILDLNESEFFYDGPIPQSRETGIVMLADSCEAALRSLKEATPEEALAMVNRILRARWQDHQLVDSGITRAEMTQIAEIFVQVWQQFNHQRIPYPKNVASSQPSGVRTRE